MRLICVAVISFMAVPLLAQGQQSGTKLTDQQKAGRRLFQQRCAICHTPPTVNSKTYGPALYKDIVEGNEDSVREFITNGQPNQMPGFRYGLSSPEIDDIVEYLKVAPKFTEAKKNEGSNRSTID
jgi:mono/diheme cytochrome c family protein